MQKSGSPAIRTLAKIDQNAGITNGSRGCLWTLSSACTDEGKLQALGSASSKNRGRGGGGSRMLGAFGS